MLDMRAAAVLAAAVIACHATPSAPPAATPPPGRAPPAVAPTTDVETIAPPWTLHVADGSANVYYCEHVAGSAPRFEYRPVTPEHSSTGTYSGGDPRAGSLTPAQVEALWREVALAVADPATHMTDREKGSVAITAGGPTRGAVIVTGAAGAKLLATLAALPGEPAPP